MSMRRLVQIRAAVLFLRKYNFYYSAPCLFLDHFVWQAWHFQGILRSTTSFLRDRCKASDTVSSTWQACHILQVTKALADVGENETCFWKSFGVAGAVFCELGRCFDRANILYVVKWSVFGHSGDSVWPRPVKYFGCIGLIFHSAHSSL